MNKINIIYFSRAMAVVMVLAVLSGCQDGILYKDDSIGYDSNEVLFDAFIGASVKNTRSSEDPFEPAPLIVKGEGKQLYLHTYVCDNSFDPVEMHSQPATRGLQVNDMGSFKNVHGSVFGLESRFADDFDNKVFLDQTTTSPIDENSDVWKIDGNRVYWPAGDAMVSFHAWAPQDLTKTGLKGSLEKSHGGMSFSYEAQRSNDGTKDAEEQVDLLLAITDASKKRPERTNKGVAELQFTHPLSAVKFAVRDVLGGIINSIKLSNIYSEGDCTYQLDQDNDGYYKYTRTGKYTWSNQRTHAVFFQVFNVEVPDRYATSSDRDEDGDFSITAKKPEATFMLIPQTIPENAEIEIKMTQKGRVNPDGSADEDKEITLTGKLGQVIKEWLPGKEYVYTISTDSENWTYVFNVSGSAQDERTDDKPQEAEFRPDDNNIIVNYSVTEGAYYNVQSYRYRSNNPTVSEPVKWTGTVLDSEGNVQAYGVNTSDNPLIQGFINEFGKATPDATEGIQMTYIPEEWFLQGMSFSADTNDDGIWDTFGGNGSVNAEKHDVEFKSQYVATDWRGDWEMRATAPETDNDKDNPIDLSKRNGGLNKRNTANCYVVNKAGWYAIPLYYGNTIKDDNPVSGPYTYGDGVTPHIEHGYSALLKFVDYNGNPITQAKIEGASKATLVWVDAYNIISPDEVELRNDVLDKEQYVVFHIRQEDLQQSNAIVAVQDNAGNIMWSWHIWVSEYWVDENLVLGQNKIPERNEVECDVWVDEFHQGQEIPVSSFTVAPRNLGWCDAKNVGYLKRVGDLKFTQNKPCKEEEEKPTHTLHVEQRGHLIEYWIGNNTYYQWGRKDPMVGFINNLHQEKYNYGPENLDYKVSDAESVIRTLQDGIKHPNHLFIRKTGFSANNWFTTTHEGDFHNLWNNYRGTGTLTKPNDGTDSWHEPEKERAPLQNTPFAYSAVKTVYDPSPPGYVVPPTTFFNVFVKGRVRAVYSNNHSGGPTTLDSFNGYTETMTNIKEGQHTDWFYVWHASSQKDGKGPTVYLTPTGQRWDKADHSVIGPSGGNMNPWIVYLWSNATEFNDASVTGNGLTAFSFVLGIENDNYKVNPQTPYIMTTHFNARKSMARPVRCIKEYENNF